MHKQYVVILETGETRLQFFPWNLCKQWVWKRNESKYKCLTCLCRRDLQLKNRSRAKATVAWGLYFISVELGGRRPGTKQLRTVLYLQVILPVQSGLTLIRRSPVPPDAVIESKVGISSLWAFLRKFCPAKDKDKIIFRVWWREPKHFVLWSWT